MTASAASSGFDREDERLLGAFAASAATAVATGRQVEEQRLRQSIEASEQERRRWARELHDETLQSLAGLRVGLSSAMRGSEEDLRGAVQVAVESVTEEIANLRSLIVELRPAALDEYGAAAAIESLAERISAREGIPVEAHVDLAFERGEEPTRHTSELESTTYRLVQEALTNAVRHAGASRIRIDVKEHDGCVEVAVSDDGRGFDPETTRRRRLRAHRDAGTRRARRRRARHRFRLFRDDGAGATAGAAARGRRRLRPPPRRRARGRASRSCPWARRPCRRRRRGARPHGPT